MTAALAAIVRANALLEVACFNAFTPDNHPYCGHEPLGVSGLAGRDALARACQRAGATNSTSASCVAQRSQPKLLGFNGSLAAWPQ